MRLYSHLPSGMGYLYTDRSHLGFNWLKDVWIFKVQYPLFGEVTKSYSTEYSFLSAVMVLYLNILQHTGTIDLHCWKFWSRYTDSSSINQLKYVDTEHLVLSWVEVTTYRKYSRVYLLIGSLYHFLHLRSSIRCYWKIFDPRGKPVTQQYLFPVQSLDSKFPF